jgi:hypothetical protein
MKIRIDFEHLGVSFGFNDEDAEGADPFDPEVDPALYVQDSEGELAALTLHEMHLLLMFINKVYEQRKKEGK